MLDDINVHIDGDELHIHAEMRSPAIKAYMLHEWTYGPYERVVDMPDDCTGELEIELRQRPARGALAPQVVDKPSVEDDTLVDVIAEYEGNGFRWSSSSPKTTVTCSALRAIAARMPMRSSCTTSAVSKASPIPTT